MSNDQVNQDELNDEEQVEDGDENIEEVNDEENVDSDEVEDDSSEDDTLPSDLDDDELSEEELQEQSRKAEEALKVQQKERRLQKDKPKMYDEATVQRIVNEALRQSKSEEDEGLDLDEIKNRERIVRLPRFQNKFILGFKNTNDDDYSKEVIHAFDVWSEKIKKYVPYVVVQFEDDSELTVALETLIKRAKRIDCKLIETKEEDASYDFGKVERQEVAVGSYSPEGTGQYVKTKVKQNNYRYVLELPTGKQVEVGPEVINW